MHLHSRKLTLLLTGAGVLLALMVSGAALAQGPVTQGEGTPTVVPIVPPLAQEAVTAPTADVSQLAEIVLQENLAWENITFWEGLPLGDERMIPLMIAIPVGTRFPDFVTTQLQGEPYALGETESATLVNFWASWCGPCQDELPYLLQMHQGDDTPFDIVLLNSWEEPDAYRTFAEATFPETLVSGRAPDDLLVEIGLQAIPVSVLLDSSQRVVAVHVGNLTGAVVDFFFALAGAEPGPGLDGAPLGPDGSTPALEDLMDDVDIANLQSGASTVWEGETLGIDEPLHMALRPGDKMPAFGLMTRDGQAFQLDLVQRPVLLNFWASWCGPCVEEFPLLIAADRADHPFDVVFVNIWDDPYTYEAFLADYPSDIIVMTDAEGSIPAGYDFEFVPVTVLVDETGIVRLVQRGPVNQAMVDFAAALF